MTKQQARRSAGTRLIVGGELALATISALAFANTTDWYWALICALFLVIAFQDWELDSYR